MMDGEFDQKLTGAVIGEAIEVHRQLGPGAKEPAYEKALSMRLSLRGIAHQCQVALPVTYKGNELEAGLRLDVVVDGGLPLELKAVDGFLPIHEAQLLTYLRLGRFPLGLLLNFEVAVLKDGIRRRILSQTEEREAHPVFSAPGFDDLSGDILNGAVEVRREMGRQLLRSVYKSCAYELRSRGIHVETDVPVELELDGVSLGHAATVPILVEGRIPIFPSSVTEILPRHESELLARLRQTGHPFGFIINFHAPTFSQGIRRITL